MCAIECENLNLDEFKFWNIRHNRGECEWGERICSTYPGRLCMSWMGFAEKYESIRFIWDFEWFAVYISEWNIIMLAL